MVQQKQHQEQLQIERPEFKYKNGYIYMKLDVLTLSIVLNYVL